MLVYVHAQNSSFSKVYILLKLFPNILYQWTTGSHETFHRPVCIPIIKLVTEKGDCKSDVDHGQIDYNLGATSLSMRWWTNGSVLCVVECFMCGVGVNNFIRCV